MRATADHRSALLFRAIIVVGLVQAVIGGCWKSGVKPTRYAQMTKDELYRNHDPAPQMPKESFPKAFTWCDQDGDNLCVPSWNQHIPYYCGSCWLHGTLSMIQDRLKIMKGGKGIDVMLARQVMNNCGAFDNFGMGCDGGEPIDVFHYMDKYGLPDETCMLYNATDHRKYLPPGSQLTQEDEACPAGVNCIKPGEAACPPHAKCLNCMPLRTPIPDWMPESCWPVDTPVLYGLKSYGRIEGCGEAAMMSEIYSRGPIVCSTATPHEFAYVYRDGVYTGPNGTDIDHDVEVVGWGEEDDGTPYWHVRNSWGTFWGEMGFYRIHRGSNLLRMEECDCWYATPTWDMEKAVRHGKYGGSMWGVLPSKGAEAASSGTAPHVERAQKLLWGDDAPSHVRARWQLQ